jgi:hypothetical protein
MPYVRKKELSDILPKLPNISKIQMDRDFRGRKDDLFLCALGFEDRCTSIPRMISEEKGYSCNEAVYFEYSLNPEDNEINRAGVVESLGRFSTAISSMQSDSDEFVATLRQTLVRLCHDGKIPKITFDISVCSSILLMTVLKILFEAHIELRLVYSEARIYHPTRDEVDKNEPKSNEEIFFLTSGVSEVFPSSEYPGRNPDSLPEAIVAFATFSLERTNKVISYIDENLTEKKGERIIWIVGEPHLEADLWRMDYVMKINKIRREDPCMTLSTFDYKETLKTLNRIYKQYSPKYHLNISPLGSKIQSLGIAMFHFMKPDITIIFAPPVKYFAGRYSEGYNDTWIIDFGNLKEIRSLLDEVGIIKVEDKKI